MDILSRALSYSMVRLSVIKEAKFNSITKKPARVNRRTLRRIVRKNRNTEFGRQHGFKDIKNPKQYKAKVPLGDYGTYKPYIKRMAGGERNVLLSQPVLYFGVTSGTTGEQKLIPTTRDSLKTASGYMAVMPQRMMYKYFRKDYSYGRGMALMDMLPAGKTEGGIPVCSATSGGMKSIRRIIPLFWTSPAEVMELNDRDNFLYLNILFALRERRLMYISGVFISSVLDMFRFLEDNWRSLTEDIRRGKISSPNRLDDKLRHKLLKRLKPDSGRADELLGEFAAGMEGIAKRIWPRLLCILTVTGGSFSVYDSKVDYYTGGLPVYSPSYAATEAMIGINPYVDKRSYVVAPDTAYFEFIPISSINDADPSTAELDQLIVGQDYEVVVTTYTGLYRYRLGDVVRAEGYYNASPKLKFLYRKNQLLNIAAEKTTEQHVSEAMERAFKALGYTLMDYTSMADTSVSPGRYVFFAEIKEKDGRISPDEVSRAVERELCMANPAYGRIRSKGRLGMSRTLVVPEGTFRRYKDSVIVKKGISRSQLKVPRVLMEADAERYFGYNGKPY